MVTGVSNGNATIYVVSGGRQGQQVVRVVPDYQGRWRGTLRLTSCSQTGIFVDIDLCAEFPANSLYSFELPLSQSGESMTATIAVADSGTRTVSAPIGADGGASFSASASETQEGITVTVDETWQINSSRVGELSGTVADVFRVQGFNGEARLSLAIVSATRTSTVAAGGEDRGARTGRAIRRLQRLQAGS
jgi:hypothetical protein